MNSNINVPVVIPLTRGVATKVDSADLPLLSKYTWHAVRCGGGHLYAATGVFIGNGRTKRIYMHRLLVGLDTRLVDHIDGDGLNNTRANLRPATPRQNNVNQGPPKGGRCYRSVYKQGNGFLVRVGRIYGGYFKDPNEAAFYANRLLDSINPNVGFRNPVDYDALLTSIRARRDQLSADLAAVAEAAND